MRQETIFTDNPNKTNLQKAWMQQNLQVLSKHYKDTKSDFILVCEGQGFDAITSFHKLEDYKTATKDLNSECNKRIIEYVKLNSKVNNMVIIFINYLDTLDLYTILPQVTNAN